MKIDATATGVLTGLMFVGAGVLIAHFATKNLRR